MQNKANLPAFGGKSEALSSKSEMKEFAKQSQSARLRREMRSTNIEIRNEKICETKPICSGEKER
jgi:hypothetical protein